ncbi:MAG: N-acetylmuramoyl-L-alanine amidase [Candidatus Omnitrophota bacterium]
MRKHFFLFLLAVIYAGCTTAPPAGEMPAYISLRGLCEDMDIAWQWDEVAQLVWLQKDNHEIRLMVDSPLVYVDGKFEKLSQPPRNNEGTLVVPYRFKEQIIDRTVAPPNFGGATVTAGYAIGTIILDAGHGGKDPGALGKLGLREKDLVLDIARKLKVLLQREGFKVIMTRDRDEFVSLSRRAQIANSAKADLFVSIHANANRSRWVKGIEIYHSRSKTEQVIREMAFDRGNGYVFDALNMDRSCKNTKAIVMDLIHTRNQADAINLARCIVNSASRNLEFNDRRIRSASFYVLKNTQIPAILVEIGYITNSREAKYLKSDTYRQEVVEAIARGINSYKEKCLLGRRIK